MSRGIFLVEQMCISEHLEKGTDSMETDGVCMIRVPLVERKYERRKTRIKNLQKNRQPQMPQRGMISREGLRIRQKGSGGC